MSACGTGVLPSWNLSISISFPSSFPFPSLSRLIPDLDEVLEQARAQFLAHVLGREGGR